jgi:hypothetical protein
LSVRIRAGSGGGAQSKIRDPGFRRRHGVRFWHQQSASVHLTINEGALEVKNGEKMYRVNVAGDLTLDGVRRGVSPDAEVVAGGTLKLNDELKRGYFILGCRQD